MHKATRYHSRMAVRMLKKESYLAAIENAVGTNLFRNLFALVDSEKKDITKDGVASCALFVSALLHQFHLLDSATAPHATVAGLERGLQAFGWQLSETISPGNVLFWERQLQGDMESSHAGFYIGGDRAISNNWETRVPAEHHHTFGTKEDGNPARAITAIYTYDFES